MADFDTYSRITARLILSAPAKTDAPTLFSFLGDPAAMRYTHIAASLEDCAQRILTHEAQRQSVGCAPWTVRERQSGDIIGWGGLYEDPFDKGWGVELAYFFAPQAWGRGFASELAGASLALARDELLLAQVRAFAHPENYASDNVLRKAGFLKQRFIPHMNRFLYEINFSHPQKQGWEKR